MFVPSLWILANFLSLSFSAENIVLIVADDLDIVLDGMVGKSNISHTSIAKVET